MAISSDSRQEKLAPKLENFADSGLRRRPSGKTSVDADLAAVAGSSSNNNASIPGDNSTRDSSTDACSDGEVQSPIRNSSEMENREGERLARGGDPSRDADVTVKFTYRPSMPAHRRVKESPLSSDAIFKQSHAGLFNLCIVVLVAVNSRLIIENLMKYGLLIRAGFWFSSRSLRDWPLLMCCISLSILPLLAFVVEKMAQHKFISEPVVASLHIVISTSTILYPVFVILRHDPAVLSGLALMLIACITWLKLVSYAHTNYDIRALSKSMDKSIRHIDPSLCMLPFIICVTWVGATLILTSSTFKGDVHVSVSIPNEPYNVNIKRLVYFMVAPTLCYQQSYPRTTCIRKGWVIRQVIKLVIFTGVMGFMIEQYINPIVKNSQHPLNGDLLNAVERVLKLSVPTLYVWLCMFYCFFHLWLNILAELLCFGDREFYKDWWNAKTIEEPVHKWMVRHVYFPCLRNGIPKGVAVLVAFFVSAVFHELLIGIPCHIFKFWAFIGIMFQVPLVIFTNFIQSKFNNTMVGNMIFWFFFSILGQPMSVLLYYHDVMNRKGRIE